MANFWAFKSISTLSNLLPSAIPYALSVPLSALYRWSDGQARSGVESNLRAVLGPDASRAEIIRQARRSFRSFGRYLCEFFNAGSRGVRFVDDRVQVFGRENLDQALSGGKGCLFVSGHYSNWEMGAFKVGRLGYPIVALTLAHQDEKINELFVTSRAAYGVTVAHTQGGVRPVLRSLKENRPVAILGDRLTGGPSVPVRFFGKEAEFPQGPWRIAVETGAPILPTFMHRRNDGGYDLTIGRALEFPHTPNKAADAQRLAQDWAMHFEHVLRKDPSQWAAFKPVWPENRHSASSAQEMTIPQAVEVVDAR